MAGSVCCPGALHALVPKRSAHFAVVIVGALFGDILYLAAAPLLYSFFVRERRAAQPRIHKLSKEVAARARLQHGNQLLEETL